MSIQYTAQALAKLRNLRGEVESLRDKSYFAPEVTAFFKAMSNIVEEVFDYKSAVEISNDFELQARKCQVEPSFLEDFNNNNRPYQDPYNCLAIHLDGLIKTIEIGLDASGGALSDKITASNFGVSLIVSRFHLFAKQLTERHQSRGTIEIQDEYDVQDLFYSLLHLYFDDVRKEEWTPSYAGSSSRMDFLIPELNLAIETKMTREGLTNKEACAQLAIDKDRYRIHPDVKHLICFVYDPESRIKNPRGFEKDLHQDGPLKTDVYVRP